MCDTCKCHTETCWPFLPEVYIVSPLAYVKGLNADGCERYMPFPDFYNPCYLGSQVQTAAIETVAGFSAAGCLQKEPPVAFLTRHISPTGGNNLSYSANGLYVPPDIRVTAMTVDPVMSTISIVLSNGTVFTQALPEDLFITGFNINPDRSVTLTRSDGHVFTQILPPDLRVVNLATDLTNNTITITMSNGTTFTQPLPASACDQLQPKPEITNPNANLDEANGGYLVFGKDGNCYRHTPQTTFGFFGSLESVLLNPVVGNTVLPGSQGTTYTLNLAHDKMVCTEIRVGVEGIPNGGVASPTNRQRLTIGVLVDGVPSAASNQVTFSDYEAGKDVFVKDCRFLTAGAHTYQLTYDLAETGTPATDLYVVRTGIIPQWMV